MPLIKSELMKGNTRGSGKLGEHITWKWYAEERGISRNILSALDEAGRGVRWGNFRVALDTVRVDIDFRAGNVHKHAHYEYGELVWFSESR